MMKHLVLLAAMALLMSCGDKDDTGRTTWEGKNAGECADGADNDGDGLYDCNDPDCSGAPDCEAEGDTDTDSDTDSDTDTDADSDTDTDADTDR